jgi:hypothetical protein
VLTYENSNASNLTSDLERTRTETQTETLDDGGSLAIERAAVPDQVRVEPGSGSGGSGPPVPAAAVDTGPS